MAFVVVNGIVSEGPGAESIPDTKPQPELVIGLLAAPGPASELTESLVGEIADRLAGQLPGVRWRVEFVSDRLVQPPTDLGELIAAGRRMLLERGWHLAVCVTDLPLQTARRPVIAHVSATHGVAVLSMPALGPVSVRKRTVETIVRLVGHILGDLAQAEGAPGRLPLAEAVTRRMSELGARTERGENGVRFVARVITGNIRLLLGMLRANRPWRLALRLMRALAVAFAAGVFALVASDIWRLSYYLGPLRLVVISLGSVAAITVTIMVTTGLWERSPHPAAREQVALFNIVTAATRPAWPTRSAWPGWPPRSRRWAARSARPWRAARGCARRPTRISRIRRSTPSPACGDVRFTDSALLGQPRLLPARVAAEQGFRLLRSPGPARVGADVGRVVEQRLHDAPGLLDAVLPREVLVVAGHRGMQQHLVWLRRLAELAGERGAQVDRAPGLSGQSGQLQPQARVRVDSQDDLVGRCPGRLGEEGQPGRAAQEQPHLGDLAR